MSTGAGQRWKVAELSLSVRRLRQLATLSWKADKADEQVAAYGLERLLSTLLGL